MKRRAISFVAVIAFAALLTQAASASNVHWKHGSPKFTDNGLTLTESGTVAGVGGGDLLITLTATANPTATCTNPGNGVHQPPGQNPAPVTVSGSVSLPASAVKNGNASYVVTTDPPTSPIAGAPDCPNASWSEDITDMAFTSASLTIVQGGAPVFAAPNSTCTFSPPTADGSVSGFHCPK
jgi:hypothetical protein